VTEGFVRLILKLVHNEIFSWHVATTIGRIGDHFDQLPSNHIQQVLHKLTDNYETRGLIIDSLSSNFDKVPSNILEQLIVKLVNAAT
jgi:hypothetical protein